MALDGSFLQGIRYAQTIFEFEVERPLLLPGFCGSSFRGAFGDIFRDRLCARRPACQDACAAPSACTYYSLFENSRQNGANIPKAMILEPPIPEGLDEIAHGADARAPYELAPPLRRGDAPQLRNDEVRELPAGSRIPLLATFLGPASAAARAVIAAVAAQPFRAMHGALRLVRAFDGICSGRILFDETRPEYGIQPPRQRALGGPSAPAFDGTMRVVFTTPMRVVRTRPYACLNARDAAAIFLDRALVRAKEVYTAYGPAGRDPLPYLALPEDAPRPVAERLYHYRLPRVSKRQQLIMEEEFDGLAGCFDLEGHWTPELQALLESAEILHVGQKAFSGLGRVRCYRLAAGI